MFVPVSPRFTENIPSTGVTEIVEVEASVPPAV
jgi:hypothetical protein